jgi:hypothetical protein
VKRRLSPTLWAGIGLGTAAFLLYAVTLTPGVPPTDSGELILAAWLPGNAHAPGFPLWVILGWLWSHLLPVGRVAWRLNLLSAFCGALAVGLTYALALRTLGQKAPQSSAARVEASAGDRLKARLPQRSSALAAAAVGAAALGLGRTVWAWATVAEVYTLSLALAAAVLLLVLQVAGRRPQATGRRACPEPAEGSQATGSAQLPIANPQYLIPHTPLLIAAAFLFGLGLGGHLTSVALLTPAIALWLTAQHGPRFWWSRTALFAGLALAAGAGVYLYLPLAAAADPLLNWGNPDTWQRFWWHVTAKQYRVSLFSSPVGPQVLLAAKLWWTQFTPVGLGLLFLGAWQMFRRQRDLFWVLTLIILCTTFYAWAYVIEDDQDAYHLPAFLAGAVWVAWGVEAVCRWVEVHAGRGASPPRLRRSGRGAQPPCGTADEKQQRGYGDEGILSEVHPLTRTSRNQTISRKPTGGLRLGAKTPRKPFAALRLCVRISCTLYQNFICLLIVALALAMNWRACNRRSDTIPEDYVRDTFAEIAPTGLLLTRDWQLVAPALYLQHVEGVRPDLTVIDTELLRRRWYFDYLHKADPGLMNSVAAEERAFLALRDPWERGEIPDGDPRIGQLQAAYVALLDAFIQKADAAGRPVHVGPNRGAAALRAATLAGQPDLEPGAGAGWGWLPVGLSFRALASPPEEGLGEVLPPLAWHVEAFRQTVPGTPERKIQATRADMAALRGLVLASAGELDRAEADWQIALAVDPAHGPATEYLRRLDAERNK